MNMSIVTIEKTKKYLVVKIPFGAVQSKRASISQCPRNSISSAIKEGLEDFKTGKTLGPFRNVREFKLALRKTHYTR